MNAITEVPNGALLSFIERAAKDESFDVAKFETLLRVRRDEAHDHARRVFNQAMAICQSEMLPVLRRTRNKGVGGRYAKLEDIDQQMRPIYTSHGFSVRFGSAPAPQPGWLRITCTVAHESGYFEENYLDSPVSNQGAQGGRMAMTPVQAVGSVVTYLRRYLLGMVFNIVQADVVGEDDDGEAPRDEFIPVTASVPLNTPRARGRRLGPQRSAEAWRVWVDKLRAACGVLYSRQEVVESASDLRWRGAGQGRRVQREISAILAENFKRFPKSRSRRPGCRPGDR
jgi:hypothetical protein